MTLPADRTQSVTQTWDFLVALTNPSITPRVPGPIRDWASRLLTHYPSVYDMERAAKETPEIFGKTSRQR